MAGTIKLWEPWIIVAVKTKNTAFLKALAAAAPEVMSVIEREWKRRRGKAMYPPHSVIERNGRRVYVREEAGGGKRVLQVWTINGCLDGLKQKTPEQVLLWFNQQAATFASYMEPQADPMLRDWFTECYAAAGEAYYALQTANEPVEEFGLDTVEEFGL